MSPPVIRSADSVTAVRVIRCGWELGARPAPRIYVMSLTKYGASERRRLVERLRDVSHTKKGNHLSMEGEAFLARPRFHSVSPSLSIPISTLFRARTHAPIGSAFTGKTRAHRRARRPGPIRVPNLTTRARSARCDQPRSEKGGIPVALLHP